MVVYNSFVIHSQETCPGSRNQMSFEIFVYEVVVTKIYSDKKGPEIQGKNEYIFVLLFFNLNSIHLFIPEACDNSTFLSCLKSYIEKNYKSLLVRGFL